MEPDSTPARPLTTDQVDVMAWALHCWTCPLCAVNGPEAMAASNQDHVTETDRQQAAFLVAALGL